MASAIRAMTGVGGDIRKIARLLQKKAPPGHMLAYINQEEADLLKARGGSGEPHADTGVPSFQEEEYVPDYSPTSQYTGSSYGSGETTAFPDAVPIQTSAGDIVAPSTSFPQYRSFSAATADAPMNIAEAAALAPGSAEGTVPFIETPRQKGNFPGGSVPTDVKNVEPSFFEGLSDKTKAKLGIGGIQSILAAYQIANSTEQAKKAREDMAKLAQPYQVEGKKLIAQAQSGQLTPAAQQQLQAAQAQAAQGAERRGGVGAQQAMMAVEGMRQQLLQNQYDYGLKVSGIGDQIATGAIRAGMQADQYVNSLASNYANNIARLLAGTPTYVYQQTQPVE